jgi:hypothetical protein
MCLLYESIPMMKTMEDLRIQCIADHRRAEGAEFASIQDSDGVDFLNSCEFSYKPCT